LVYGISSNRHLSNFLTKPTNEGSPESFKQNAYKKHKNAELTALGTNILKCPGGVVQWASQPPKEKKARVRSVRV
jgi:hypothetical protein